MKEHMLLEKAYIYPLPKSTPDMIGFEYDSKKGFWIDVNTKEPFVMNSLYPGARSKKCDVETGEDQKGE